MSVIEHGAVEAPEVLTEREQRARTLEAAALEIEVRGWATGPESGEWWRGGPVCFVGGICAADSRNPGYVDFAFAEEMWGRVGDMSLLWRFNDFSAKSGEEVSFLLRWRAEEIRDGWDA